MVWLLRGAVLLVWLVSLAYLGLLCWRSWQVIPAKGRVPMAFDSSDNVRQWAGGRTGAFVTLGLVALAAAVQMISMAWNGLLEGGRISLFLLLFTTAFPALMSLVLGEHLRRVRRYFLDRQRPLAL